MKINKKIKFIPIRAGFVLFALFFFSSSAFSSDGKKNCIRKVFYEAVEYNKMAINENDRFESLSDYDLTLADPNVLTYDVEICIEQNGDISFIKTYDNMGIGKFGNGYSVNKVEISKKGVKTYDFRGALIKSTPLEKTQALQLSSKKALTFGIYDLVSFDKDMINSITRAGGEYFLDKDQMHHVCKRSNNSELIYSSENLLFSEYRYDQQGLISSATIKQYRNINRSTIPAYEIRRRFETGSNRTKIQIDRVKKYLTYKIEDKGKVILDFNDDKAQKYGALLNGKDNLPVGKYDTQKMPLFKTKVSFSEDKLKIDVPVFDGTKLVQVKIYNSLNEEIYCISRIEQNSSFSMSFDGYKEGTYRVECSNGIEDSTGKFNNIKDKKS